MKTVIDNKYWFVILILVSGIFYAFIGTKSDFSAIVILLSITVHFLISLVLTSIPWGISKLLKKPLDSKQFMWTFTIAFALILGFRLLA